MRSLRGRGRRRGVLERFLDGGLLTDLARAERIGARGREVGAGGIGRIGGVGGVGGVGHALLAVQEPHLHQTSQRFSGGAPSRDPGAQLNAFWNSGRFESGPMTRNFADRVRVALDHQCAAVSGRIASPRNWPQAMKNCWSGVKPSSVGCGGLPCCAIWKRAVGDPRAREVADRSRRARACRCGGCRAR